MDWIMKWVNNQKKNKKREKYKKRALNLKEKARI